MSIREEVQWFSRWMEEMLQRNSHKPGWKQHTFEELTRRLKEEVRELAHETIDKRSDPDYCKIIKEAADVANFAMMIADNARRKLIEP